MGQCGTERFSSMADGVLFFRKHLGVGLAALRNQEDRVIAEAITPTKGVRNSTHNPTLHRPLVAVSCGEGDNRDEGCTSSVIWNAAHLLEHQEVLLGR